jgi:hypothetical protein
MPPSFVLGAKLPFRSNHTGAAGNGPRGRLAFPSEAERKAVLAVVGRTEQDPACGIDQNALEAAQWLVGPHDAMAATGEIGENIRRNRGPERQRAIEGKAARHVRGLLRVALAVEELRQDMGVAGGLVLAAHHAERHHGAAVLRQQPGNDGVEGPFARPDRVGMAGEGDESRHRDSAAGRRIAARRCRCRRRRTAN